MKKSSPYVMTSRQINIPYLLKIGEGKIAKIGKYLFDKDMTGIALFWGEGMEKMLGGRLKRGLDEHGIEILSEDTVSAGRCQSGGRRRRRQSARFCQIHLIFAAAALYQRADFNVKRRLLFAHFVVNGRRRAQDRQGGHSLRSGD